MKLFSSLGGRKTAFFFLGFLIAVAAVFFWFLPHEVDRRANALGLGITEFSPPTIPAIQKELRIVDLHADTLLWDRDLLVRGKRGHVDLPRLQEGPVALQVFSVVTQSPRGINYKANADNAHDNITILAVAERWPFRSWFHKNERAFYQAEKFAKAVEDSQGNLRWIKSRGDLEKFLSDRKENPRLVAGLLAMEGAQALEGDFKNLDRAEEMGYRMISTAHMVDTEWSGSQQGEKAGGLTELGREWVRRMNQKKLIIDLAHISSKAIDDILSLSQRPSVVSHTGLKAVCESNRNLSDDQVRSIAKAGGVIGIGFWSEVNCGHDLKAVVKTLRHAVDVAGVNHVALGSDWDGFVDSPVDAAHISWLTGRLSEAHFSDEEIRKIMGENALNFFLQNLPD